MTEQRKPKIIIEKLGFEHLNAIYDAIIESRKELFAEGFLLNLEVSLEELEGWIKESLDERENDKSYDFNIIDSSTNDVVGWVFLNKVNRQYQMANLGYWVRTSRLGEGIATEAARLIAQHGFEKLGFQRLEIVVHVGHAPSLKIAEKLGAVREGLLRNRMNLHGSPIDAYMHSLIPSDYNINITAK